MKFEDLEAIIREPQVLMLFEDTNWRQFRADLYSNLPNSEIGTNIDHFHTKINFASSLHSKIISMRSRKYKISREVQHLFKIMFDEKLWNIKPGPYAYRLICGLIGKSRKLIDNELSVNDVVVNNENEKLDILWKHFARIYIGPAPNRVVTQVESSVNNYPADIQKHIE